MRQLSWFGTDHPVDLGSTGARRVMMLVLAFLLAMTALMPAPSFAAGRKIKATAITSTTTSGTACPADDGSAGAASATIQYPTLLSGYVAAINQTASPGLNCKVAGVDYAVGYPSTQVLKDWQTIPTQSGNVTVNMTTNQVRFTSTASSCVVDGYDFSLHGGASLLMDCANPTITNSNFSCGATCINNIAAGIINFIGSCASPAGTATLSYNIINGGSQNSANEATLVFTSCPNFTAFKMQYNWFKNFSQNVLEISQGIPSVTYKYNLIDVGGFASSAHLNYVEWAGGTSSLDLEFNTSRQSPQLAGGEGYQIYNGVTGTNTFTTIVERYNTLIATGSSAMSYMLHGLCHATGDCASTLSTVTTSCNIDHNYADITGALGLFYPSAGTAMWTGCTLANNTNMVTGAAFSNSP